MRLRSSVLLAVSGTTAAVGLFALYYTTAKGSNYHRVLRWLWRMRPTDSTPFSNSLQKAPLREYQSYEKCPHILWVSICGTIFDISGESTILFHPQEGCYARWIGHDVTELLILGGIDVDEMRHEDERSAFDNDMAFSRIDFARLSVSNNTKEYRRYKVIEEWYKRFCLRYPIIGQATDIFANVEWAVVRQKWRNEVQKPYQSNPSKCPLGFGNKNQRNKPPSKTTTKRMISFYGKQYDVSGQASYEPDGPLAHFVGHDITFAIANGSKREDHLNVKAEYSFDQQLFLEHYRTVLEQKCAEIVNEQSTYQTESNQTKDKTQEDLTKLLQKIVSEGNVDKLKRVLDAVKGSPTLNEPCPRSGMTLLHRAVESDQEGIVRLLLEAGADVNATASLYEDATPLDLAKRFASQHVQELLLLHQST